MFTNAISVQELTCRNTIRSVDVRGAYYRDTTAIIHSSPFRRLKHKTQVFFAPSNDHICTRIEHALHVASIASAICRGLGLDSELAWAIGMGHDLGHAPFGHVGEKIINSISTDRGIGTFEHEIHSLRVVDFLAEQGRGLNLTYAVRDGIVSHNGELFSERMIPTQELKNLDVLSSRVDIVPATWEGVVVRFADQISYLGRDFEDACRLSVIHTDMLPSEVRDVLGCSNSSIIGVLVEDLIKNSHPEMGIGFSPVVGEAVRTMKRFNYAHIYKSPMLEGYTRYFSRLIHLVVEYLQGLLDTCGFDPAGYRNERNMLAVGFFRYASGMSQAYIDHDGELSRMVLDYVAGMSDNFCLDCANEILKPEHLNEVLEHSITGKWFDAIEGDLAT